MAAVISCRGIGKRYRLGASEPYALLRDRLAALPRAVARSLRGGSAAPDRHGREVWALRDIDLDIEPGEVIGIIGRNGAGKSTLLKVLSRITAPTVGEARIVGRIGSLLEVGTGFHPELTGRENVYVNGAILGMRRREIARQFDEIVEFAGVEDFIDTPVKRYSSGMRLRLAFAVAAHLDVEIIFIDEALSVGDASFQKKCFNRVQGISRSGRTVILVSHQLDVISGLCDRVFWMESGSILESGDPDIVVRRYIAAVEQNPLAADGYVALPQSRAENPFGFRAGELALLADGRTSGVLISGKSAAFRIRCWSDRAIRDCEVAFWIKDAYDRRMVCLYNKMAGVDFDTPAGSYVLECSIPRLPLNAGDYSLDLSLSAGTLPLQQFSDVARFSVAPGDFFEKGRRSEGYGEFLVDQDWRLAGFSEGAGLSAERPDGPTITKVTQ